MREESLDWIPQDTDARLVTLRMTLFYKGFVSDSRVNRRCLELPAVWPTPAASPLFCDPGPYPSSSALAP